MRRIAFLAIFLVFTSVVSAQQADLYKYVLYLSDKGVDNKAAFNPSLYLSEKSIERRLKFQIAFDETDIPVNENYIKAISQTGARILARSRWFNTVVIEATEVMASQISSLQFITRIQNLEKGSSRTAASKSVKPFFEGETISPWINGTTKNSTADYYNYGSAYNQIHQLNGEDLHNKGYRGQGMTIAVIDAGFNAVDTMSCFKSLWTNGQILGYHDFADPGNDVFASTMNSHGTSVLSCMAANVPGKMVGTAPEASYWLLRSEVASSELIIEEYYWVSAAEWAESQGADLINSSLGYTKFDDQLTNHTYADMDGNTTIVTKGADMAAKKGILVVNSIGNSGGGGWWYMGAPADGDSVFAIGAVTPTGVRSNFSSVGPTYDKRISPSLVAQGTGVAIYTPYGLATGSGTSFSSPIICGMTACYMQANPAMTNIMQVMDAIKATGSQASAPDSLLGWGIPNFKSVNTSIREPDLITGKKLSAYPNPITDKVTLVFPETIQGNYKIEIFTIQGKVAYSIEGTGTSLRSLQVNEIGSLPSGIYLLNVSNNFKNYSCRIVKI